jgi:hypothetical protein
VIATVDPRTPLPRAVLNYCTRKIAGMLVFVLQKRALRMVQDPVNDALAQLIRRSPFYDKFLLPRVIAYAHSVGWEVIMPAALTVPREEGAQPVRRRCAFKGERARAQGRRLAGDVRGRGGAAREGGDGEREEGSSRRRVWVPNLGHGLSVVVAVGLVYCTVWSHSVVRTCAAVIFVARVLVSLSSRLQSRFVGHGAHTIIVDVPQ